MKWTEKWFAAQNPYPHVIAANWIEHTADCPACAWVKSGYDFIMWMLDRVESAK